MHFKSKKKVLRIGCSDCHSNRNFNHFERLNLMSWIMLQYFISCGKLFDSDQTPCTLLELNYSINSTPSIWNIQINLQENRKNNTLHSQSSRRSTASVFGCWFFFCRFLHQRSARARVKWVTRMLWGQYARAFCSFAIEGNAWQLAY